MSYILDALRRADAERQQGQVPGLHAAPAGGAAEPPRTGRPAWVWLALAVLLVLAAVVLWLWWPRPAAVPTAAAPAPVAVAVPSPRMAPASAPEPVAVALPIVVSAAPAPPAEARPAESVAPAPGGSTPAVAAVRPLLLTAMPPDERRQLPPLMTGGSVWSDSAASRFVILDGQVLREGDAVAAGLVLERIERKAAVLRWKDQRVEVPF